MASYTAIFQNGYAIALIILFFCGSIFVHELGHFLAAKWRGLKVLKFSIGFGPKLFGWTGKDGCEYRISLLPLGGYVALPQLADMGRLEGGEGGMSELEKLARSLPKISYFDKMAVSAAGAFFNILFALLLACFVWIFGVPASAANSSTQIGFVPRTISPEGETIENPAYAAGLREGDVILAVDGTSIDEFSKIMEYVAVGSGRDSEGKPLVSLKAKRGDEILDFSMRPTMVKTNARTGDEIRMIGVFPASGLKVGSVMKDYPAQKAGLLAGDIIEKIDGARVYSIYQISEILNAESAGHVFDFEIMRGGKNFSLKIAPEKVVTTRPLCEVTVDEKRGAKITFICSGFDEKNPASADVKGSLLIFDFTEGDSMFEGLSRGMELVSADGVKLSSLRELNTLINHASGKSVTRFAFGSTLVPLAIPQSAVSKLVDSKTQNMLGYLADAERITMHPSVGRQFGESLERTWNALASLANPSSDIGLRHLSGPVGIGRVMYKFSLMDFMTLLSFVVLINVNLAVLNLLPIPVLDGGHMLMATISKIIRRPIPESVMAGVQGVFMFLILGLVMYVMYFDVMRWQGDTMEEDSAELSSMYHITTPKK